MDNVNDKFLKHMLDEWERITNKPITLQLFDNMLDCIIAHKDSDSANK